MSDYSFTTSQLESIINNYTPLSSEFETVVSSSVTSDWLSTVSTVAREDLSSLLVPVEETSLVFPELLPILAVGGLVYYAAEKWLKPKRQQSKVNNNNNPGRALPSLDESVPFVSLPSLLGRPTRRRRRR
jgi:hypothetical protein